MGTGLVTATGETFSSNLVQMGDVASPVPDVSLHLSLHLDAGAGGFGDGRDLSRTSECGAVQRGRMSQVSHLVKQERTKLQPFFSPDGFSTPQGHDFPRMGTARLMHNPRF